MKRASRARAALFVLAFVSAACSSEPAASQQPSTLAAAPGATAAPAVPSVTPTGPAGTLRAGPPPPTPTPPSPTPAPIPQPTSS